MAKEQIEDIAKENIEANLEGVDMQEEVANTDNYDDFIEFINDPRTPFIVNQLRIIRDVFNVPDLMAVMIVIIRTIDAVANTPDLARMVTIASKFNDGTITTEEVEKLYNGLLGAEEETQGMPADMQEQGGFPSSKEEIEQDLKQGISEAQEGTIVASNQTEAQAQQPVMQEPKKDSITIRTFSVEDDKTSSKDESIADFINRKSKQMGFK